MVVCVFRVGKVAARPAEKSSKKRRTILFEKNLQLYLIILYSVSHNLMNHSGGKKQGRGDKPVHRSQSASHERRPGKDSEDRSVSSSGNHDNSRKKHNSNGPHGHGRSGGRGG